MRAVIFVLLIVVCLIAAGVLSMSGVSYYTTGYGLHPVIVGFGVLLAGAVGAWAMGALADLCGEGEAV